MLRGERRNARSAGSARDAYSHYALPAMIGLSGSGSDLRGLLGATGDPPGQQEKVKSAPSFLYDDPVR